MRMYMILAFNIMLMPNIICTSQIYRQLQFASTVIYVILCPVLFCPAPPGPIPGAEGVSECINNGASFEFQMMILFSSSAQSLICTIDIQMSTKTD